MTCFVVMLISIINFFYKKYHNIAKSCYFYQKQTCVTGDNKGISYLCIKLLIWGVYCPAKEAYQIARLYPNITILLKLCVF